MVVEKEQWRLEAKDREITGFIGVPNPEALMKINRRRLQIVCLGVINWCEVRNKLIKTAFFNCLSTLGELDLICESFDAETGNLRDVLADQIGGFFIQSSSSYSASECLWYHGHPWHDIVLQSFKQPTDEELKHILLLSQDWNQSEVPLEIRSALEGNKLLVPIQKRARQAFAYIFISSLGISTPEMLSLLPKLLLERLENFKDSIEELYRIQGGPPEFQFLLKVNAANFNELSIILNDIHDLHRFGYRIYTRTHPILESLHEEPLQFGLSRVDDRKRQFALNMVTEVIENEVKNAFKNIQPLLTARDIEAVANMPQERKKELGEQIVEISNLWNSVNIKKLTSDAFSLELFERSRIAYARSLVTLRLSDCTNSFVFIYQSLERVLTNLFSNECLAKFTTGLISQQELGLPTKDLTSMSLGHILKGFSVWNEKFPDHEIIPMRLIDPLNKITRIRNSVMHARVEEDISIEDLNSGYIEALRILKTLSKKKA